MAWPVPHVPHQQQASILEAKVNIVPQCHSLLDWLWVSQREGFAAQVLII